MNNQTVAVEDGMENVYVLILWPYVQELMGYDWFRAECILYMPFDDQTRHDSAYFVPPGTHQGNRE
ncbi:MAG TPA: hypothetical protein VIM55_19630 [Mucilaginibacter sp.]